MLKTVKDIKVEDRKILVRCDFNVPLNKDGLIEDDFRIRQALPTIKYLIKNKAKTILISHLGNPKGKVIEKLKLDLIKEKLEKYLSVNVMKANDCIGKEVENKVRRMKDGNVLLLENLRFHKEEKENDLNFAKSLAGLADVYVNNAFGSSHRAHASIVGIPKFLPSVSGLLLEKEINILNLVLNNLGEETITIIGGAKISSKSKVIKTFLNRGSQLLVGGKIANAILAVRGICVEKSLLPERIIKDIKNMNLTSVNFHLPVDVVVSSTEDGSSYIKRKSLNNVKENELILDIGPETIKLFSKIIKLANTIIWAGPLGLFENPLFEKGTRSIAEAIIKNKKAFKVAGGGDTALALLKFNLREKFNHVSTGGGAMLAFLGGEKLPGIEALR